MGLSPGVVTVWREGRQAAVYPYTCHADERRCMAVTGVRGVGIGWSSVVVVGKERGEGKEEVIGGEGQQQVCVYPVNE
jgi:hypothetical protein